MTKLYPTLVYVHSFQLLIGPKFMVLGDDALTHRPGSAYLLQTTLLPHQGVSSKGLLSTHLSDTQASMPFLVLRI